MIASAARGTHKKMATIVNKIKKPKTNQCPFCEKTFNKFQNIFRKTCKCEKCNLIFCKACTTIYFDDSEAEQEEVKNAVAIKSIRKIFCIKCEL